MLSHGDLCVVRQDNTWRNNAVAHLKADASVNAKVAKFLGFGIGADIGIGGSLSTEKGSTQTNAQTKELVNDGQLGDHKNSSTRTSDNKAYLESLGIDKAEQKGIRESFSETKRLAESMSVHKDKIKGYHENIDYTRTHSNEFSREMTQDVIEGYKEKYKVGDDVAGREVSKGTGEALGVFHELSSQKAASIMSRIQAGKSSISTSNSVNDFAKEHRNEINTVPGKDVQQFAEDHKMVGKNEALDQLKSNQSTLDTSVHSNELQFRVDYAAKKSQVGSEMLKRGEQSDSLSLDKLSDWPVFEPIIRDVSNGQLLSGLNIPHLKK